MNRYTTALLTASLLFLGCAAVKAAGPFSTPVHTSTLDPAAFAEWVDGAERPLDVKGGPAHVIWTDATAPEWDGVHFGRSRHPGPRCLRIGFTTPVEVGSVVVRAGGSLSVLKPSAAYPGNLADDSQWLPANRLTPEGVTQKEASSEDYVVWTLPPGCTTRALRLTHTANVVDTDYEGWLGGAFVLSGQFADLATEALADASDRPEVASRINDGANDNMWNTWDNGPDFTQVVSAGHPVWVMLAWPRPVTLVGLNALWAGFGSATAQAYDGPSSRNPRNAIESDWTTIKAFTGIQNQYPRALGVNWMGFDRPVTTRAIRLLLTSATTESHPHLIGKTYKGGRVWLGELMALASPGNGQLSALAMNPVAGIGPSVHAPIPVRFTLKEPGFVTLVIEDSSGRRVRNLVSETPFPAGKNVVWWDGTNDLGRDAESAHHGLYHIPASFVQPGNYRVRGLFRKGLSLHYEFTVYSAGNPPWPTADHTGGWLTNHTPASSTVFVPGDRAPGGKPLVFIGSYVAEGGDGLAWVDLDGKKQGGEGWVGGAWTGAPYLAYDAGANPVANTYAYAGSAWDDELRLTALTSTGDHPVVQYKFEGGKDKAALSGMAALNGVLVCSLPKLGQALFVNARSGKVIGAAPLEDPRGLAFDHQGRLLALSGQRLLRFTLPATITAAALPMAEVVIQSGLEDPQAVTVDSSGLLYVSDRGQSNQIKVFSPEGRFIRAIGHAGAPKAGLYDPLHMNNPNGIAIDSRQQLWVAETDFQPKRVSVWTLDGRLLKAFYGPPQYGGGGVLDSHDPTCFYYHGMEFHLDWKSGTSTVKDVFYRPGPGDMSAPDGHDCDGMPETPIYAHGLQYMANCYDCNPTNGANIAMIWVLRNGIAVPVAALGRANDWSVLKTDAYRPGWPAGVDLNGDYWKNQTVFLWCDRNGDGHIQPDEVTFMKANGGAVTVMPDLSFVISRLDGNTERFAPTGFTAQDAPLYNLLAGQVLAKDVQGPVSSGGDQALAGPNGWTVLTVAPKPFAPESLAGAHNGIAAWSYPSLWPGLHPSHESPAPDRPGELVGTTRLLGGFITPRGSQVAPLWAVNGNMGPMYLFTADGLFVATLFKDMRQGIPWSMPTAERGMLLNDVSPHDENFWPSISSTPDGTVYVVDGDRTSLVRIDGLDTLRPIAPFLLKVTDADLRGAEAYIAERERARQTAEGVGRLTVALRTDAPVVDGKMDDWAGADRAIIDRRGVAAYFNSNSKPYDVTAALAVSGDRLYAAYWTGDAKLLANSGETPDAPFKTGGALDLMLGANPAANPNRTSPVQGDIRLLVTQVKGHTLALIYRPVAPGTTDPVAFSSPWRTIHIDRVDDVSNDVQLAGLDGNYELSIPLADLGLKPQPGLVLRGDVGILRGDGSQTLQRVYWANKATAIMSDVPSEAMLTPGLWGTLDFEATPAKPAE